VRFGLVRGEAFRRSASTPFGLRLETPRGSRNGARGFDLNVKWVWVSSESVSAAKQNQFGARPAARAAGFLAEGDMDYAASPRALARSFST
jgi:hypothetical protein